MPEIVKKNPVNEPTQKPVKTHSKFVPNYSLYTTHRFGLNSPHFAMAAVADDDISVRVAADVDTFSLKAPLMQPVRRSMDYFQLPLRCLLPNTSELLITNPLQGDDVIAENVNSVLSADSVTRFNALFTYLRGLIAYENSTNSNAVNNLRLVIPILIRYQVLFDNTLSSGSVLSNLGYNLNHLKVTLPFIDADGSVNTRLASLDDVFDLLWSTIRSRFKPNGYFVLSGYQPYVTSTGSTSVLNKFSVRVYPNQELPDDGISFKEFLSLIHEPYWLVVATNGLMASSLVDDAPATLEDFVPDFNLFAITSTSAVDSVNLLRLVAYQKACAEFYTSDKVDAVYSAKLWEDNMLSLLNYVSGNSPLSFMYNGIKVYYDACSGAYLESRMFSQTQLGYIINTNFASTPSTVQVYQVVPYLCFHNLFGYTRSLKYQDYFVGSRVSPLAVGDVSVGVDTGNNTVDIVDVSRNIQIQRFLNQVNRVGRKFSDYVKGILGDKPMKDVHEPIFLGHVVDTFGAEETENTGSAQLVDAQTITSKLRNNSNRFGFDVHVGEPSVLIGITNYDIPRVYSTVTDRENYHIDRYDMFNPYMQFVGDQEVKGSEIVPHQSSPFGYQMRYAEYRQRVDIAAGGFVRNLPGYAKVMREYDVIPYSQRSAPWSNRASTISSDFIRARETDIDEFYVSLAGTTRESLFNFIVRNDVSVTARRPMAFAPSIL